MTLPDVLSIWEIAHRWHHQDPNITDPEALPLEVQDSLRFLTKKMAYHQLPSCSPRGVRYTIDADIESIDEIISHHKDQEKKAQDEIESMDEIIALNKIPEKMTQDEKESIYEDYLSYMDNKMSRHNDIIEGFEQCYEKRIYDKNKLDNTFTLQHELAKLCLDHGIKPPKFWYPENWEGKTQKDTDDNEDKKLRPNQIDKQLCQAVASTLWNEYPDLNIQQLINHPAIQRFANGAQYKERTLRDWVKAVDPRPKDARHGRPKKLQS